jgi:hypothetical protein
MAASRHQHASLFGHTCFDLGDVSNACGTGAFLLFTLGNEPVTSEHGLLATVAWKLGDADPVYALEGWIAMAGALVQWLRDNLGIIDDAREVETLARSVEDSAGVVFGPAPIPATSRCAAAGQREQLTAWLEQGRPGTPRRPCSPGHRPGAQPAPVVRRRHPPTAWSRHSHGWRRSSRWRC